jgi:hypothetical protein
LPDTCLSRRQSLYSNKYYGSIWIAPGTACNGREMSTRRSLQNTRRCAYRYIR